jgi:hypothetical protein
MTITDQNEDRMACGNKVSRPRVGIAAITILIVAGGGTATPLYTFY